LYILIFMFSDSRWEDKRLQALPEFNLLLTCESKFGLLLPNQNIWTSQQC
jgi:hypothetical protein